MSKKRNPELVARSGKNPEPLDFTCEVDEGVSLADELAEMLDDDPRAISWMMNAMARAKAANESGLSRREICEHMALISEQAEQLATSLKNPTWWDALLPAMDANQMKAAGYWPDDLPASPENEEKRRWLMIEHNMIERLQFLGQLSKRAKSVSEQFDPKGLKQPNWPAHGLAKEIEEGIRHGILPFSEIHEQSVAQELFAVSLKAAGITARKPLRYYLPKTD